MMKGSSGKQPTINPTFGYTKDGQGMDKWEDPAKTVQYIFKLCRVGLGPERLDKLSAQYEKEQQQVWKIIGYLQSLIDSGKQEAYDLRQFLRNVRKYTDLEELTAKMLNEPVDKIVIHASDKCSDTADKRLRFIMNYRHR